MQNPPGLLTASKSRQFQCEQFLNDIKAIAPFYSTLRKDFKITRQNSVQIPRRDISLYGKPSLINFNNNPTLPKDLSNLNQNSQILGIESVLNNNNSILLDKEYQSVLDELTNKQSLKKQLERQKNNAYQELQMLDKRQNDMLIDLKHDELNGVLKRRNQLEEEEKRIQMEMQSYEAKRKEMEKQIQMVDKEDYIFKEARYAGKLAKQRQILEEKKMEMQRNLKQKRKEKAQIQHKLNESKLTEQEVYIPPNFRKNKEQPKNQNQKVMAASNPSLKTPEDSLDSLSFQNTNRVNSGFNPPYANHNEPIGPPSYPHQNVGIQHWPTQHPFPPQSLQNSNSYQSPLQRSTTEIFNLPHQKYSQPLKNTKPEPGEDTFPYFTPDKFSKNQKLLTDMLNKNGKSQQDAFIQLLNAQEYDTLNLLAKIPKTSQLYQVKLKQYQELSKLRDEYKKQAHQKRIDKMKREFDYEKKLMEKEMQNAVWVDENRKLMLAQQINIVNNQEQWEKQKDMLNKQALMQRQQQPMANSHNNNQYGNQNQNQYATQNPGANQVRNQTPVSQSRQNINSYNSIAGGDEPQLNPYESYLNNLQQSYSSQQARGNTNPSLLVPPSQQPQQFSNQNMLNTNNPVMSNNRMSQNYPNLATRPNEQPPVDPSDYMWGYKISVEMLKNYRRSKPVKIKLIVKEHDVTSPSSDLSALKYEYSTTYHYQKIAPQQASFNPNMNNKFDAQKNILYKEDFTIPINLQEYYNSRQNEIYLWVFALEKDETKLSNQPSVYAWYTLKLTHFGQVKEGKFAVNLYSDQSTFPVPSDMNKKKNKLQEEIVIELNEVLVEKEKPPPVVPSVQQAAYQLPEVVKIGSTNKNPTRQSVTANSQISNTNPVNSGQTNNSFKRNSSSNNQLNNQINNPPNSQTSIVNQFSNTKQSKNSTSSNEPPFIPLEFEPEFVNMTSKEAKNLDITLAQIRTLPSYTGPVKIELSFIDPEGTEVLPRQEILTDLGSADMYNPFVNYVKKIRNQKLITPTTMVFIRLLALNALDYEIYMLGFTVFYFFFNEDGDPCPSNDTKEFLMSTGYYQLPIFWGSCEPVYAKIEEIIQKYPLIPCTSLLFGCHVNTNDSTNKVPKYGEKVYNTTLFHAEDNEIRLFEEQYKREKLDSNKILKGYLQFKGFTTNYSPQQANKYFFKTMGFTKDNTSNLFPLQYMAEYNQFFGIYFSVDKLIIPNEQQNYYYFMTVCLTPPGKYYTSNAKDADELKIIWAVDPDSSKRCQLTFANSDMVFQPKYDMNTCLIVEFKRIKIGKENQIGHQVQSYAFVIVPLFKEIQEVRCVNVSQDTVNTYPGAFNPKDVQEMKKDLAGYLDRLGETATPSEIDFTFRVLNGYFTTQFNQERPQPPNNRKSSYFSWYSRPIDFEDANKKIKAMIQKKYQTSL